MRPTLNPLAALAAAMIVTVLLCAAFLALLAMGPALAISPPPDIGSTPHAGHAGAWRAGFGPCALLLAVVGGIALAGALFRSERRVGPALRVSTRGNSPRRAQPTRANAQDPGLEARPPRDNRFPGCDGQPPLRLSHRRTPRAYAARSESTICIRAAQPIFGTGGARVRRGPPPQPTRHAANRRYACAPPAPFSERAAPGRDVVLALSLRGTQRIHDLHPRRP
jgi:hypothetical protein